jgi:hypothetical protein
MYLLQPTDLKCSHWVIGTAFRVALRIGMTSPLPYLISRRTIPWSVGGGTGSGDRVIEVRRVLVQCQVVAQRVKLRLQLVVVDLGHAVAAAHDLLDLPGLLRQVLQLVLQVLWGQKEQMVKLQKFHGFRVDRSEGSEGTKAVGDTGTKLVAWV